MSNRLEGEKSPYLLQHAESPVNWYPWGEDAFVAARESDRPIFLSIGYATCHWCHVMGEESFADGAIAKKMNESFINVKVDREEMPELDNLYMGFAQALMSSGGGWPLNVILTPELKPFFATTYLPPRFSNGMMGLSELIDHIRKMWEGGEREMLNEQASKIVEMFEEAATVKGNEMPTQAHVDEAVEVFFDVVDPVFGGIRGAPKFPMPYHLSFLMQYAVLHEDSRPLFYVEQTLDRMCRGGIYDQIGSGFSRYSVDEEWLVPHFEKMLYDNAVMLGAYLDAYRMTSRPRYKEICEELGAFLLREFRHKDGGFCSAEDADSEGHEGLFYLWTREEIDALLPPDDAALCKAFYGMDGSPNFEDKYILHESYDRGEFAQAKEIEESVLSLKLAEYKKILFEAREKRKKPFLDDKVLTSWNALAIDALVKGGALLEKKEWIDAAVKCAKFIKTHLWKEGRLLKRYRDGQSNFAAGLDDYSYMIRALLTLAEYGLGEDYLLWAREMMKILLEEFKAEEGAFYTTGEQKGDVLLRKCEYYDGALPTGNAVAVENLVRFFQLSGQETYLEPAEDILKAAKTYIESYPPGTSYFLLALQRMLDQKVPKLIVAKGEVGLSDDEVRRFIASYENTHLTTIWKTSNFQAAPPIDGKTTLYLSRAGEAFEPMTSIG